MSCSETIPKKPGQFWFVMSAAPPVVVKVARKGMAASTEVGQLVFYIPGDVKAYLVATTRGVFYGPLTFEGKLK